MRSPISFSSKIIVVGCVCVAGKTVDSRSADHMWNQEAQCTIQWARTGGLNVLFSSISKNLAYVWVCVCVHMLSGHRFRRTFGMPLGRALMILLIRAYVRVVTWMHMAFSLHVEWIHTDWVIAQVETPGVQIHPIGILDQDALIPTSSFRNCMWIHCKFPWI